MTGGQGDRTVFTERLDFRGVLMVHLVEMSREAARDGYFKEYEDLVDLLVDLLWPYIEGTDKETEMTKIEALGEGLDRHKDKVEFEKSTRTRIRRKTRLCLGLMKGHRLLLRNVRDFDSEFDPTEIPEDEVE